VIYLTDLGSSNGTSINGLEVEGGKNIAVHDNDQIQLADAAFSVEINLS
jgi:pSer/pThr/pTyr-binding forkhead associated (FHA) protein